MADILVDREGSTDYRAPRVAFKLSDFELLRRLGDGSFSEVVHARERATGCQYALKVVDKSLVVRHKVARYLQSERRLLDSLQHPGIVRLHFTFQDDAHLYFGLQLCPNGDLYEQLRVRGPLPPGEAAAYLAQLVAVLGHLAERDIVHRDIKPENLLLDARGNLVLADFGSAKQLGSGAAEAAGGRAGDGVGGERGGKAGDGKGGRGSGGWGQDGSGGRGERGGGGGGGGGEGVQGEEAEEGGWSGGGSLERPQRATSMVGTAEYVSPEVLSNAPMTTAADLWGLGCVAYQLMVGQPPFKGASEYLTFQLVSACEYSLPGGDAELPDAAADFIRRLLVLDPSQRLGARDRSDLRGHPFFEGVDWESLWEADGPAFVPPAPINATEEATNWELLSLQSLAESSAVPRYHYEYNSRYGLPSPASSGGDEGGGGAC